MASRTSSPPKRGLNRSPIYQNPKNMMPLSKLANVDGGSTALPPDYELFLMMHATACATVVHEHCEGHTSHSSTGHVQEKRGSVTCRVALINQRMN